MLILKKQNTQGLIDDKFSLTLKIIETHITIAQINKNAQRGRN